MMLNRRVIDFFARPGNAHAVLRHLQTGRGDAAGVSRFARTEKNLRLEELIHAVDRGRHVRAFGDNIDAVPQKIGRVFAVDLILRRARKRALAPCDSRADYDRASDRSA